MPAKKTAKKTAKKAAKKKATVKKSAPTKKAASKAPKKAPLSLVWDANVPQEVEAAKDVFRLFSKRRQEAFHMTKTGGQGKRMLTFDGTAGAMVFRPLPSRYDRIVATTLMGCRVE